jgi:NAD(P)-dependent dehydrogenase (short-subunit alcohol dehydrogenase family)
MQCRSPGCGGSKENAMDLTGAAALVTGGASGLGLATARRLAEAGVAVTIVDLPASAGADVAAELGGSLPLT